MKYIDFIFTDFTYCFVSVWNLISHTKGGTEIEGVWEEGADENVCICEGGSGESIEKTT